jgi:hypothetical protein
VKLTFSHYDAVKLGTKVLECGICRGTAALEFNPGDVNFVLKDGESGGWASKALKENKYRAKRQGVMERRQRDHAPNPKLVPNFAGEQLSSWSEARAAAYETAYEETRDATAAKEAASTYDPLVQRENAK